MWLYLCQKSLRYLCPQTQYKDCTCKKSPLD
nr:MAG TPA: hypothetical protein [Inoviridae sp.]